MAYKVEQIEGVGPASRDKLNGAGIETTDDLLKRCGSARGRNEVSELTGLSETALLEWTNMADLMRISGVGRQFAELLEASGVDTLRELRNRCAEKLAARLQEVNTVKRVSKTSPSRNMVQNWIDEAQLTDPRITH